MRRGSDFRFALHYMLCVSALAVRIVEVSHGLFWGTTVYFSHLRMPLVSGKLEFDI